MHHRRKIVTIVTVMATMTTPGYASQWCGLGVMKHACRASVRRRWGPAISRHEDQRPRTCSALSMPPCSSSPSGGNGTILWNCHASEPKRVIVGSHSSNPDKASAVARGTQRCSSCQHQRMQNHRARSPSPAIVHIQKESGYDQDKRIN